MDLVCFVLFFSPHVTPDRLDGSKIVKKFLFKEVYSNKA